jgi:PAS domain S-box-containing protein
LDQELALKTLLELGLTPIDAQIYLFLIKKGPKKGKELLASLKINRQQLYRSLKALQSRGIVNSTLERPACFVPIPPQQVIDIAIKNKENEFTQLSNKRKDILAILQSAEIKEKTDSTARFSVIEGENYLFARIEQMVREAKQQIWISADSSSIIQAEKAGIVRILVQRHVPFKILTNVSLRNLSIIETARREFNKSKYNIGRHIEIDDSIFPLFFIRDEAELIFIIKKEGANSGVSHNTGLWTNSKPLIDAFKTFFGILWRDSITIDRRIQELESGKSSPEIAFIRNSEEAYNKFLSLINSAKKEIILMTSEEDLKNLLSLKPTLNYWKSNDIKVRIMAPISSKNEKIAQKLAQFCKIRNVQVNCIGEVVVDNQELLHFKFSQSGRQETYFDNSFYTNDSEYVQGRKDLLNDLWNNSPTIVEEIRRREARFRSLFESSFDAILLTSPDGSIFSANSAACKMFGMTEEEIKETAWKDIATMKNYESSTLEDPKSTGKKQAELFLKRKDESMFEAEITSSIFTDSDGILKTSMIIRDITERKKRERELRQFSTAITASADGIIMGDQDGFITEVNQALLDMAGSQNKDDFVGKHITDFLVAEEITKAKERSLSYLKRGFGDTEEYRAKRKDGSEFFIEATVTSVKDETGKKIGFVDIIRDVTKHKKTEKALIAELNLILDSSPMIIFYKNKEGKIIQANQAFARTLNTDKEYLIGKTVFDIYSTKIAQSMTADDLQVMTSKKPKMGIIEPYESPTGIRWIRTYKIPTFDENGSVTGLIGFSEEVPEPNIN